MVSHNLKKKIQYSIYWFLRIFLGLFLLAAGIGKILDISGYVEIINTYEMGMPLWIRWITAIAIIIAETGLAFWILSGWQIRLAALLSFALHASYFVLLAITFLRGVDVPNCGCFGVFLARPLEPTTLLKDLVLITFSWGLYMLAKKLSKKIINYPSPIHPLMQDDNKIPTIEFPLRGKWKAVNSPGHHRYAYDFAAIEGTQKHLFAESYFNLLTGRATVSDSYSWDKPIYSPFDCEVIQAKDGWTDRKKLNPIKDFIKTVTMSLLRSESEGEQVLRSFTGNYIILRSQKTYAFMAHMQCNSLSVQKGQRLSRGELIGRIGNSGNTLIPHLHLQLMDGPDLFDSNIIPFRIRHYKRWNGDKWETIENSIIEKGKYLRYDNT